MKDGASIIPLSSLSVMVPNTSPSAAYEPVTTAYIAPSFTVVQPLINYSRKANEVIHMAP